MKAFYFLLLIVFISSCNACNNNNKVQNLSFTFVNFNDKYSLNFYNNDMVILKSLEANLSDSETVYIRKENKITLDSFISIISKKRHTDSVFYL